ncbi:phosphatase PAP2 family protein [Streptococcus cuniculipharyngis]|uniref:Phosphatase PAP2 family protein n=1 Tax=Streptococcus cuniculipharyngis TaxID=1562651 RepID=A0A5C5SB66_9STRE|nr:phosphatase PAP2 family protein [Streptococcus cuniculipharyngis]TWS96664.1 phosphatase PAP2 family protein [Streptococcus cuniculipharyngis]
MKNRTIYWLRGSFALVIFVCLGYLVKFYPETLAPFDRGLQATIRGSLPQGMTHFFKTITLLGNTSSQLALVLLGALCLWLKGWKSEAGLLLTNGALASLAILGLKAVYQRPRPSLNHLVEAAGYSFPSGHSLGPMLIIGTAIIIVCQRMPESGKKKALLLLLALVILLLGLSRIYLGVHYPSDVLAGFLVGYALLNITFPYYDYIRFQLRFTGKQS